MTDSQPTHQFFSDHKNINFQMFKTAATKIAHNSTLPSLAGNKDLRPLQDLIIAEKAVLVSLQKLSIDFNKASEALRTWGAGEGEDLGDTLSASTTILAHFSSALTQYATREHSVRDEMKNVRSREEALDELKRRRKSLVAKAESAEKKLNKMNPENKNLASQTDILNRLKDEIRVMDTEIMSEEASLGDFKRITTQNFMTIKFGGLLECCEKGSIAGEYGKLVISEIPVDTTQPGLPRSMYGGHAKTEDLVAEAQRCVSEVSFSTLPATSEESHRFHSQPLDQSRGSADPMSADNLGAKAWDSGGTHSPMYLGTPQGLGRDSFLDAPPSPAYDLGETIGHLHQPYPQQPSPRLSSRSVDDFGVNNPGVAGTTGAPGGRFATFPVKSENRLGGVSKFSLHDSPMTENEHGQNFASSVADALSGASYASGTQITSPNDYNASSYEVHSSTGPPRSPLGTSLGNPWSEPSGTSIGSHDKRLSSISDAEAQLAYMSETPERPTDNEMAHGEGRQVHLGRVGDVHDDDDTMKQSRVGGNQELSRTDISRRIPPPSFDIEDERSLNAAAAREVSRELDALNFNPPSPLTASLSSARPFGSPVVFGRPAPDRAPSPLAPPAPLFAKRAVSPMPGNTDAPPYQQLQSQASPYIPTRGPSLPNPESPVPPSLSVNLQGSSVASDNSPYRTPPEYPRRPGSSAGASSMNPSTSSLAGQMTPSTRTISASAFKRPQPRLASLDVMGGAMADTSPLTFKKRLPSSPYPQRSPMLSSPTVPAAKDISSLGRPQQEQKPARNNSVSLEDDDQFDYISAYVNSIGPSDEGSDNHENSGPVQAINGSGRAAG